MSSINQRSPAIPREPPPAADAVTADLPETGVAKPDAPATLVAADEPYDWFDRYPAEHRELLIAHGMMPADHPEFDEVNRGIIRLAEAGLAGEELRRGIERLVDEALAMGAEDPDIPEFPGDADDIGD